MASHHLVTELGNAGRVAIDFRRAARRYRVGLPWLLGRAAWLVARRGFRPREALDEGLLDPAVGRDVLAACIGKRGLLRLQRAVNVPAREVLTEDKSLFYPYCEALGLPVPGMLAVWGRGAGHTRDGEVLVGRKAWVEWLRERMPETCVLKPAFGYYGLGFRILHRRGGLLHDHQGRRLAPDALLDQLAADRVFRKYVFQHLQVPHPDLRSLSGSDALQTARVITDVDEGVAELNHAYLRLATGGNVIDNYQGGHTGNFTARIDRLTGRLAEAWGPAPDGIGVVRIERHPGSGIAIEGFALPHWPEVRALVERAALLFAPVRCIGWDVAFTPGGPVLIEANMWWDASQLSGVDVSRPDPGSGPAALLRRLERAAAGGVGDPKG